MAKVQIKMCAHTTVGYARLRREWSGAGPVEEITIERETSDPPQTLRITMETSPPVTWPILKTLGASQRSRTIQGNEFHVALRPERLAAIREGEREARIQVMVHDDSERQVGGGCNTFDIEPWNAAPSAIGPGRADEDEAGRQHWKDEEPRWARFVTPNARIIDQVVGDVVQQARGRRKSVRSVPQWCAETTLTRLKRCGWGYARHTNVVYPADALAQRKAGSCADSSVTFAAAMLGMGLHPVLVLMDGHMMAGVWSKRGVRDRIRYDEGAARARDGPLRIARGRRNHRDLQREEENRRRKNGAQGAEDAPAQNPRIRTRHRRRSRTLVRVPTARAPASAVNEKRRLQPVRRPARHSPPRNDDAQGDSANEPCRNTAQDRWDRSTVHRHRTGLHRELRLRARREPRRRRDEGAPVVADHRTLARRRSAHRIRAGALSHRLAVHRRRAGGANRRHTSP